MLLEIASLYKARPRGTGLAASSGTTAAFPEQSS